MIKRLTFILIYLFFWVVFFELARIFFLLYEWPYTSKIPASIIFQSLWYGLKMDLSMASYITVPVCLFVIASMIFSFFSRQKIYIIYTGIVLFIQVLLIMADTEIYKAWGTRIDFTALKYLSTPKEMWASISHLPIFWIITGLVLLYFCLLWGVRKIIGKSMFLLLDNRRRWIQAAMLLVFSGMLIIPIRGGIQLAPLNHSSVYFSKNQFANNAAQNVAWNFMYSVAKRNQLSKNPYEYMPEEVALQLVKPLYKSTGNIEQVVNVGDSDKPNVIFILWESFTEKALQASIDGKPITPHFEQLKKEGIYFSNCYASGDRTDKGISALLSGYPALTKGSIINYPHKSTKLQGLGELFLNNGYTTGFYYGGEPEFANIKSYITGQKFQQMTSIEDFDEADMNSKWGAHDDVVMKRIVNDLSHLKQPFFTTWLTLSSHEPFETTVAPAFKGNDNQTKFLNSLHYTDGVIYELINELKKQNFWNNTIVIISADHGHLLPVTGKRADDYRIPVLWLGGALNKKNVIIEKTTSQLDIAGSITSQFRFAEYPFQFGKNLFDSTGEHWAFFTYNDGVGFVTDSSRLIFDNAGKRVVYEEGRVEDKHIDIAKALMQLVYGDFLKK